MRFADTRVASPQINVKESAQISKHSSMFFHQGESEYAAMRATKHKNEETHLSPFNKCSKES